VHTQQWAYEAGGSEDAGRVIEPRKGYSRGQQDIPQGRSEGGKKRKIRVGNTLRINPLPFWPSPRLPRNCSQSGSAGSPETLGSSSRLHGRETA
jgi:hypothetical protein